MRHKNKKKSISTADWLTRHSLPDNDNRKIANIKISRGDTFKFDKVLDVHFLDDFYDDNLQLASKIFHLFLTHTFRDFAELIRQMESMEWKAIRKIVHRLKPNFQLVGLVDMHAMLIDIELKGTASLKNHYLKVLEKMFFELKYKYIPIISREEQRLKKCLELKGSNN